MYLNFKEEEVDLEVEQEVEVEVFIVVEEVFNNFFLFN